MTHIRTLFISIILCALPLPAAAQSPLLRERDISSLAQELSGEIAKRNLEGITRFHRQRGSQGFHSAAEIIVERAPAVGCRIRGALGTRQQSAHDKNLQL